VCTLLEFATLKMHGMKMMSVKKSSQLVCSALVLSTLTACAPALIGGGAATVTGAASQERGIDGVASDAAVVSKIMWHYTKENNGLSGMVDVVSRQGKVLLTGTVDEPKKKVDAVRLAWLVKGVKEVVDEIKVAQEESFATFTQDSWLTTKIKTALLFDKNIHSINYNIQTIEGKVYVMGVAPNQAELDRLMNKVRRVGGVKEVINLVQVGKKVSASEDKSDKADKSGDSDEEGATYTPTTSGGIKESSL